MTNLIAVVGIHLNGEKGHITYLAVSPVWQKQGLGTYLLRLIINLAQKWHCVRLSLEVRKDNKIAQELYCRFGFVTNFVRPDYYQDVHQDGLNMILDLPIKQKKGKNFG
ncbi:N-acetyltransferase [Lactobacillus sp. ESL0247]|uniref:GNAT family N-acetyltransferase n=1 Tax=Lactobacillus sp. ESL0247 TaxID=2069360 RepID=UPI0013147F9C|nr:N-acetyltransferase [Lactobacillus sp. ESL0247]